MTRARRRAATRALTMTAALVVAGIAGAAPASAHNYVVGSDPAADQTTTGPVEQVAITFDDVLLDLGGTGSGSGLDVVGPDGAHYATGCPTIVDRTLTAPTALGTAGTYTVDWRVVSADGHPVSGRYAFDYAPPPDATPATGTAEPACAPASGSAHEAADAGSQDAGAGLTGWALAGIAVGTILIAGGGVLLALGRGRPARAPR